MTLSQYNIYVCALACSFLTSSPALSGNAPWPPLNIQSAGHKTVKCDAVPPPVKSLSLVSKYGNDSKERDDVDEEAQDEFNRQMEPVRQFEAAVVKDANAYVRTGQAAYAECVLASLASWALADGLTEMGNHTAEYKRGTTISGLALALLQVRGEIQKDPRFSVVTAWLVRLAEGTVTHFDTLNRPRSTRNNHRIWAGLGVAAVGAVTDRARLLDWGKASFEVSACTATPEGALPLEMERGKKAREYQLYALNALSHLAAVLEANGRSVRPSCSSALERIAKFALDSIDDPSAIEALSRAKIEPLADNGHPKSNQLAFVEPLLRLYPSLKSRLDGFVQYRPYKSTDLGGDVTLLYGMNMK